MVWVLSLIVLNLLLHGLQYHSIGLGRGLVHYLVPVLGTSKS